MIRIACFLVPLFPLAARLRSEPDLLQEAVAIVEGNGNNAHVVAATRRARKKGIRQGHSLAQARSILPKLIARGRDAECERTAQEALLEVAETFSPRVEDAGNGLVYVDITGMERHFEEGTRDEGQGTRESEGRVENPCHPERSEGFPSQEPRSCSEDGEPSPSTRLPMTNADRVILSRRNPEGVERGEGSPWQEPRSSQDDPSPSARLRMTHSRPSSLVSSPEHRLGRAAIRAADAVGLPIRAGIAASKLAARIAAELPDSPNVIAPGDEARFLAPLPLARLTPQLDASETLQRWGIGSIGDLARLPESEVASRLGELGRELHWAARGIDPRPLIPRPLPMEFREGMDLEWPLVALEPFLFVASAALDRLARRLEVQGLACTRIEMTLQLEPDGYLARAIDLPAPTRDVKTILTLIRLDLEKTPPGAPVTGFTLVAHPDRPRRAQLSLFGPAALSPEKLATTIARLISMIGEDRVGMAMTVDGHLPDRYAIDDYNPPPPPDVRRGPRRSRGLLAVRTFRPPIPVEVITRPSKENEPGSVQIESIRALPTPEPPLSPSPAPKPRIDLGKKLEIAGPVRVSSGPWAIEEGWWTDSPAGREYWDVEIAGGGVYRVYRDCQGKEWYVDAAYD
ncbi:MAG TPA: hypothetical protein VEZ11_13500 [Thermoanaerobaculia bacterium]|nr:hypothetical protein [Thermoanaerobaculia bacterium]